MSELAEIVERVKRGESITALETERVRKDGRKIHVSLSLSPMRDASGQIVGISTVARDITDRKRAENELRTSNENLARFNRAAVDRELRMIELKKEINALCAELGRPQPYPLAFEKESS